MYKSSEVKNYVLIIDNQEKYHNITTFLNFHFQHLHHILNLKYFLISIK